MLMNARPRIVSHGFENSAPVQRPESLHQRLVDMTNNDINAWNFFGSVANPTTDGWDQNFDEFNNNENFPLHTLYSGYCQETSPLPQRQSNNASRTSLYTPGHQIRGNTQKATSDPRPMQQRQATGLSCVEKQSPMLSSGYSQWNIGQRHGSFAEFTNTRNGLKNFAYQNLNESIVRPFTSAVPLPPHAYQEDASMMNDCNADNTSPSTAYSSYSSPSATVDPISLMSTTVPAHQDALIKNTWWADSTRDNKSQFLDAYGMVMNHDGHSRFNNSQYQQYSDSWNTRSCSSAEWATQPAAATTTPITISPKALILDIPVPSFSTSASSQGGILAFSASSSNSSSREDTPNSGPETLSVVEQRPTVRPHRRILPDAVPGPRIVPVLQSNDFASRKTSQKQLLKSRSESRTRRRHTPLYNSKNLVASSSSHKVEPVMTKALPKRIEPKPINGESTSDISQKSTTAQAMHHRDAQDDFLVKSKLAGMSYKDIRRQGDFVEAESTLRGRFRTLTKHKAARVRKPEWTDNDIKLLKKSVRKLTNDSDTLKSKVPWKQVAEYIANNGGSYHFGNATCRKRWDELQAKARA